MIKIITSMILLVASLFSINAYALNVTLSLGNDNKAWRCEASNRSGNSWYAISATKSQARYNAIRLCERYTSRWNRCYLDGCAVVKQQRYSGRWQCNVASADGQVWFGTGKSSSTARTNALRYCRGNSFYPRSCDVMSCFKR